jgi:predicted dehydrogenase
LKKLGWGLVGGGEGSQIGFAHRAGSVMDRKFKFVAGAMDIDPNQAAEFGVAQGLERERSYANWQEMLEREKSRDDCVQLVTIATPNATHHQISKAFLEGGFHVLCEKPMTMTVEEAKDLVTVSKKNGRICAVNYGYTGYPMVRQMRAMVENGELGSIRVVVAEFAGGFMADAKDADNPRVRWRFDPNQAGMAAVTVDCGIHALHMACFVTGQHVTSVSSDFGYGIKSRELEDDNLSAFRMSQGTIGRLWTSGLAIGRIHGLTLQVFGEFGGLRWTQEQPNQLFWTPLNQATQILERGGATLSKAAQRANRITVGHPEGMVMALANLYKDLGDTISAKNNGNRPDELASWFPNVEDGCHSIEIVQAMVKSAKGKGVWVDV